MQTPRAFQSPRALKRLNIAAVGLALAAATGAVFTRTLDHNSVIAASTALPTLLLGMLWAWLLRQPHRVGNTSLRWGWLASLPLAALNAALACGLLFGIGEGLGRSDSGLYRFAVGAFLGATFGAMFWIPGLIATLTCFGVPVAWAQRLARKGLAGEERGEVVVGLASAAISVLALVVAAGVAPTARAAAGIALLQALAALGLGAGGAAAALGTARARRRRAFVAKAEAGAVAGYRVDATPEGKVLIRVVSQGEGYRVADFEQEVFALDVEGNEARPRAAGHTAAG